MQGFSPEQMQLIQTLLDEQVGTLQQENERLKQQIAILDDGNSIKRSDYQALEERLRKEQDETMKLSRENNDLRSKYMTIQNQNKILENQISNYNRDVNSSSQAVKAKDDKIIQLQEEIKNYEKTITKQKLDLSALLMEKTDFQQKIKDLCAQNQELQDVTQQLIEKDNNLVNVLSENASELAEREREINDLNTKIRKLESKVPSKESSKDNTEIEIPMHASGMELSDSQSVVLDENMKKKIADLKEENEKLKDKLRKFGEDADIIDRMEATVEKQKKENEALQNLLDKSEREKEELHNVTELFTKELRLTKDKLLETEKEKDDNKSKYESQIKILKDRLDHVAPHREALEQQIEEKTNMINELREQNLELQNGELGLSEAITQIKEMKRMIELRDQNITNLVRQLNTMDKIIDGLSGTVSPDFDVEKFIISTEDEIMKMQDNRLMIASRELNKRLDMLRRKRPHSQIKIIVENQDNADMHMTATLFGDEKFKNDGSDNETIMQSTIVARDITNEEEEEFRDNEDDIQSSSLDSYSIESLSKTATTEKPIQKATDVEYVDTETQCRPETSIGSIPTIKPEPSSEQDHKEWIENMKKDLKKAVQQSRDLSLENDELKARIDKIGEEKVKLMEQLKRKDAEQKDHESEEATLRMTIDRMELEREKTQIKSKMKAKLSISATVTAANKEAPPEIKLSNSQLVCPANISSDPLVLKLQKTETMSILPSEAEKQKQRAKEDAANERYKQAMGEVVSLQRLVADSQTKLDQKDRTIKEKDQTISKLEKNMQDERERYKERLYEIQKTSQETLQAQLKEALDPHMNGFAAKESDYRKLPEVSEYINELKRENNSLKERNNELMTLFQSSKNDCEILRNRVKSLEAEKGEDENRPDRDDNQQANLEYMKKLQRENSNLKKKVAYYSDENEKLKAIRERRETDIREKEPDDNAAETIEKLTVKNKTIQAKYAKLKQANADQAAAFEKEKAKSERLKSALAKKEETVQLLTEKNQKYKHQNEKLKSLLTKKKESSN